MTKEHIYIAIDLKSFYASVECKERGRSMQREDSMHRGGLCMAFPAMRQRLPIHLIWEWDM